MRVIFTCGGTAGHINPALAIAGKIGEMYPDSEFLFIGSGRELENRLVPEAGYRIENLKVTGFSRKVSFDSIKKNVQMINNLRAAEKKCGKLFDDFRPDVVIGTGGYVCYPVITVASKRKIRSYIHESNAVPGLTTKMVAGKVEKIFVAFPGLEGNYKYPEKVVATGIPVRPGFGRLSKEEAKKELGISEDKPLTVSFWGSLGAARMNEIMADFIEKNYKSRSFYHIHATGGGQKGLEHMLTELAERKALGLDEAGIDLRAYIDDMDKVMTAADLVLCRAGASTIGELTYLGKPSILVPSPNVTNNHQEKNARVIEKLGGAKVILDSQCTGEVLYNDVLELIKDKKALETMGSAAAKAGVKDSAGMIVKLIFGH